MSTGYRLQIGYNSAGKRDELWPELRSAALAICEDPLVIANEMLRLEPEIGFEDARAYSDAYKVREDLTVTFHDQPNSFEKADEFSPYIYQMASGGGTSRERKETARRAFCRLVIEAMHKKRIEVNLIVS